MLNGQNDQSFDLRLALFERCSEDTYKFMADPARLSKLFRVQQPVIVHETATGLPNQYGLEWIISMRPTAKATCPLSKAVAKSKELT